MNNPKYLIWNRQYVGNSLLFHRKGKAGYTTDIAKAHLFDYQEALKFLGGSKDHKIISFSHIDQIATRQVHADHIDHDLFGKEVTNE